MEIEQKGEWDVLTREYRLPPVPAAAGVTLITCGILQALCERGMKAASFKCGPDYIDPMFHSRVLGTKSRNLDTFFTNKETTRYLFCKAAAEADISVMEGVMGYYDGLGGVSAQASAYDLARVTDTPTVLIVNCKGMSLSVLGISERIFGIPAGQPDQRSNLQSAFPHAVSADQ